MREAADWAAICLAGYNFPLELAREGSGEDAPASGGSDWSSMRSIRKRGGGCLEGIFAIGDW